MTTKINAVRDAIMLIFPDLYPGACFCWKVCVPSIFPTAKATRVNAFAVTFFEWPAIFEAFQASNSMKAAPNVPERKEAAKRPLLFLGMPFGSRPIIRQPDRMVGTMTTIIISDLSRHLSEK